MKTLDSTSIAAACEKVEDIQVFGDGDTFRTVFKASSERENWMKSTKACEVPGVGCFVQVTTQQGGSVAEAVCFAPGVRLVPREPEGYTFAAIKKEL